MENIEIRKNISTEVSWLDRDIKRFHDLGTMLPLNQIKIYEKIRDISEGLTVVDVGCSVGVGANIISHRARHVWGIDINKENLKFANHVFARPNLSFEYFDLENPPSRELAKFNIVLMSEVIEHLDNPENGLHAIKRFFNDKTVGYINTPNRNNPNLDGDVPKNPLHIKEWRAGEFYELLIKHFRSVVLYSVPKLNVWNHDETIDGNATDTPMIAKVQLPI